MAKVGIIMGSLSDLDTVKATVEILDNFGVERDVIVSSAHRTPSMTAEWAAKAKEKGYGAVIAFAGAAAHLAGVVAAYTNVPVIAVPLAATSLQGLDALYSTVQMPAGVPVAVMAIGIAGAKNAAYFACRILGVSDNTIYEKLNVHQRDMALKILKDNERIEAENLLI